MKGLECQILDRYSFSRFLSLHAASNVRDCTIICRFRNDLANAGVVETLFSQLNIFLAAKGQIVDANVVSVPI